MKVIIKMILGFALISNLNAQNYSEIKYNFYTPFTGIFSEKRFKGSGIRVKEYNDKGEIVKEGVIKYRHSKDGLRDTVYGIGLGLVTESVYDDAGRLVVFKRFDGEQEWESNYEEIYTYNPDGRIASVAIKTNKYVDSTFYDYINHSITKFFEKEGEKTLYESSRIAYTDSGYICRTLYHNDNQEHEIIECVFDDENKLTRRIYIEDGKTVSDVSYFYTDSSYYYYNVGMTNKYEHVFNEEGFEVKKISYVFTGEEWLVYEKIETSYLYDDSQSNTPVISDESQSVYGVENGIVVIADVKSLVNIYTISGQLVKKVYAQPNEQILLPKGIYIVRINEQSYKVRVR